MPDVDIQPLVTSKYVSLTTYKRDGTAIASPVWIVDLDDGTVGMTTASTSFKVKRLANNPKVLLQPSSASGKVAAGTAPVEATAEVVGGQRRDAIAAKVRQRYGVMVPILSFIAKIGGFVKRKPRVFGDAAIVITFP